MSKELSSKSAEVKKERKYLLERLETENDELKESVRNLKKAVCSIHSLRNMLQC